MADFMYRNFEVKQQQGGWVIYKDKAFIAFAKTSRNAKEAIDALLHIAIEGISPHQSP